MMSAPSTLPAPSRAPVTSTRYVVEAASAAAGVNVLVSVDGVVRHGPSDGRTTGPVTTIVGDPGSTASLKRARTVDVATTPTAPSEGVRSATVGTTESVADVSKTTSTK